MESVNETWVCSVSYTGGATKSGIESILDSSCAEGWHMGSVSFGLEEGNAGAHPVSVTKLHVHEASERSEE